MGKKKLLLSAMLSICLWATDAISQTDTVIVNGGNASGKISFDIQTNSKNFVFSLYGDGTFGIQNGNNVKHKYKEKGGNGYEVISYFIEPYDEIPPPKSINTGGIGADGGANIPIRMNGEIDILTSWAPASEHENFFIIAFRNTKSASPVDGCIEFHYHDRQVTLALPRILDYGKVEQRETKPSGKTGFNEMQKWKFRNLKYNEVRYIYVPTTLKIRPNNKLKLSANMFLGDPCGGEGSNGGEETNNTFLSHHWPHDPNFKIVEPNCLHKIEPFQQLIYTVGFFNDGTGFAKDVFVKDELDPAFDPQSVRIIESEYDNYQFLLNGNEFEINYLDMFLPGTNQTNPQTYTYEDAFTYFKFSVCAELLKIRGDCLKNQATIQFDNQAIFITTEAEVCKREICNFVACNNAGFRKVLPENNEIALSIIPNPFTGMITLNLDRKIQESTPMEIDLLDLSGKVIQRLYNDHLSDQKFEKQFYLEDLPAGIYWIRVKTGDNIDIEKVIKL